MDLFLICVFFVFGWCFYNAFYLPLQCTNLDRRTWRRVFWRQFWSSAKFCAIKTQPLLPSEVQVRCRYIQNKLFRVCLCMGLHIAWLTNIPRWVILCLWFYLGKIINLGSCTALVFTSLSSHQLLRGLVPQELLI